MATTDGNQRVFVDTNILIYASLALSPLHQPAVQRLRDLEEDGIDFWISRQVLREYLAAMTRPGNLTGAISMTALLGDVRSFASHFQVAEDGSAVTEHLLALLERVQVGGRQVHDANIVATMLAHGIGRLLTHNVADFARYAAFITVIPLAAPTDRP